MTSLRWLKLNRTGLCYLPEELAALQKLVSSVFWDFGMEWGSPVPLGPWDLTGACSLPALWLSSGCSSV